MIENKRIERHESFDAAPMECAETAWQVLERKANFCPRGEMVQTKINRIRAGFDGSAQLGPVTGGAHQFGFVSGCHVGCCRQRLSNSAYQLPALSCALRQKET